MKVTRDACLRRIPPPSFFLQHYPFAGIRQSNISCVTSVDLPDPAGPSARVLVP